MKILICPLALAFLVVTVGCRENTVSNTPSKPMRHTSVVVHLKLAGGEAMWTEIAGRHRISQTSGGLEYGGQLNLANGIRIDCDYIGRGDYPVAGTNPSKWADVDLYLVTIINDQMTETVPVLFNGQTVPVNQNDEYEVTIRPTAPSLDS